MENTGQDGSVNKTNTSDAPWPVAQLAVELTNFIKRLGSIWVEGQLAKITRQGTSTFAELRDLKEDITISVHHFGTAFPADLENGDRVAVLIRPDYWKKTGRISHNILEMRKVGLGELLERIQRLRQQLATEGLSDPSRKQPLPFLPTAIGLITSKDSDAEKDVKQNALLRWPEVQFKTIYTKVSSDAAAPEIIRAIQTLDADPDVEVIIIARGGGSFGDLLVFSDEALVRAAAAAKTPIVSAIGHENDRPVLDDVADLRASTPTDAAKRVVPDVVQERRDLDAWLHRAFMQVSTFVENQMTMLLSVRSRPVLANPHTFIEMHEIEIRDLIASARDWLANYLEHETKDVDHAKRLAISLSPQSTLDRGYAVVRTATGEVLRDANKIKPGTKLKLRLAKGETDATAD